MIFEKDIPIPVTDGNVLRCNVFRPSRPGRIDVPVLSAGNWGGPGVHLRGNIEGYMRCGSREKWLSMHVGTHFESFYLPEYVAMQKRFLDHYLKGLDNGWNREARVQLSIRGPHSAPRRMENEFPLARTAWTRFYLDASKRSIRRENPTSEASVTYDATGEAVTFTTAPFEEDLEVTGFITLRLWISSSTTDMDIFATLRAFAPDGTEVIFDGAHEPTPVSRGWLRASHRALAAERSTDRAWHAHREVEKLAPGALYAVDVEIWPTSMVYPRGYRLALNVAGRDFEIEGIPGRILHQYPASRDPAEFGGTNTIVTGAAYESYVLLPVIPA